MMRYIRLSQTRRVQISHSGAVQSGFGGRTIALGLLAVVLAIALGALAGTQAGAEAGVLAALAGLVPPALLAVAVEQRSRNAKRFKRQQEIIRRFAPPQANSDEEDKE